MDWVLHGHEEELQCLPSFNDSSELHCDWPSQLAIQVTEQGGSFRQQWLVQHERWLQLPRDTDHWPVEVKVNGQTALVINREGGPYGSIAAALKSLAQRRGEAADLTPRGRSGPDPHH